MPIAPSGTRPISTWRRDSISHSSEPMPMPTENTTSSSDATCSSPCSTSLAKDGNSARNTAPKNHIHEMPSSERKTTRLPCASFRLCQVSVTGFQLMRRPGSVDGDVGTYCATTRPSERDADAGEGDVVAADAGDADEQAAGDLAEQDGDEGAHLDHAVAAGELALAQVLRQVGELDRAEQRRVQAHQEDAGEQHVGTGDPEAPRREQHDRDLEVLDEADDARLVVLVGQLAAGGGEQQERQDEERADGQARELRLQEGVAQLQLVGHHHGERELEQVVVAGAQELGPEERREAALAEQRELVRVIVGDSLGQGCGDVGRGVQAMAPEVRHAAGRI